MATADKEIHHYVGMHKVDKPGLPTILIPTTAGTSAEWTWVAVVTDDLDAGKTAKKSMYSKFLRARAVIVDPLMTVNLSPKATAETGIDALSHAVEAYTTWKANPISDMFTEKVISLLSQNLRSAYGRGNQNIEARYHMAICASLGFAYMISGAGIVHGMGYPLQMSTHIAHGESMAIMMPPVMEFNLVANPPRFARIAELMGENVQGLSLREKAHRSVEAVRQLIKDVRMPLRMRDVGVKAEQIPGFVEAVFMNTPHLIADNCRIPTREDLKSIYEAAM
jgi:alcohol dehydrogenase class IV